MKKMFIEVNQIHNFMSSSGSGTVINYGSGSDFLTTYGPGSTTLITALCIMGGGGGVSNREQRSRSRSRRGGFSENWIAGSAAARLFFLTAVAIAIATTPFKFHEISVSNTSSSFVSSIHSLGSGGDAFLVLIFIELSQLTRTEHLIFSH